jgi:hypothetical protein
MPELLDHLSLILTAVVIVFLIVSFYQMSPLGEDFSLDYLVRVVAKWLRRRILGR